MLSFKYGVYACFKFVISRKYICIYKWCLHNYLHNRQRFSSLCCLYLLFWTIFVLVVFSLARFDWNFFFRVQIYILKCHNNGARTSIILYFFHSFFFFGSHCKMLHSCTRGRLGDRDIIIIRNSSSSIEAKKNLSRSLRLLYNIERKQEREGESEELLQEISAQL